MAGGMQRAQLCQVCPLPPLALGWAPSTLLYEQELALCLAVATELGARCCSRLVTATTSVFCIYSAACSCGLDINS